VLFVAAVLLGRRIIVSGVCTALLLVLALGYGVNWNAKYGGTSPRDVALDDFLNFVVQTALAVVALVVAGFDAAHYRLKQYAMRLGQKPGAVPGGAPGGNIPRFPTEEFIQSLRERFPGAEIDQTSNELGTVWISVRTETGHAEIVATADGTIGGTDIAHDTGEESPFEPFAVRLGSVDDAKAFVMTALTRPPKSA